MRIGTAIPAYLASALDERKPKMIVPRAASRSRWFSGMFRFLVRETCLMSERRNSPLFNAGLGLVGQSLSATFGGSVQFSFPHFIAELLHFEKMLRKYCI